MWQGLLGKLKMNKTSVVIPIHNAEEFKNGLEKNLKIFSKYQEFVDVILVDNNSNIATQKFLLDFCKRYKIAKYLFYDEKQSSYAARNAGVSIAKGAILLFIDSDCLISDKYVDIYIKYVSQRLDNNSLICGNIEVFDSNLNIYSFLDSEIHLKSEKYSLKNYGATANMCITKQCFNNVGGFLEVTSGGDQEFCRRAISKGVEFVFFKELVIKHPARSSFNDLIKKSKRVGQGLGENIFNYNRSARENIIFLLKQVFQLFIPFTDIVRTPKLAKKNKKYGYLNIFIKLYAFSTVKRIYTLIYAVKQ